MLESLIEKTVKVVDDVGVETVLTLAFVAQIAASALPGEAADETRILVLSGVDGGETGTVVQMPASPGVTRGGAAREGKAAAKPPRAGATSAPARVRRPDPTDDAAGAEELDQPRAAESSVRITIIGPDGQPRTKVVRLSGSRDGMSAPARRPHD